MKKILLVLLFLALSVKGSEAALMIAVDVNGVQACAVDNNAACGFGTQIADINPTLGVMSFGNIPISIGGVTITGSAQQQTVLPGQNILNTSSTQITNNNATTATVMIAVGATDYQPVATEAKFSGSATWENAIGSSIFMTWWNDPTNQQGGQTASDLPGILIGSFADNITLAADATAVVGTSPVFDPNLFSMALGTTFTLTPGATVVNRGQTVLKDQKEVPEPALLLLFAVGLIFFAARKPGTDRFGK